MTRHGHHPSPIAHQLSQSSVLSPQSYPAHPVHAVPVPGSDLAGLLADLHQRGASLCFQARGRSMSPAIQDADLVTVSPLGRRTPSRGDVVAFRHPETGRLLVHRVLSTGPAGCVVKGDNVRLPDGTIPTADLLGVVTRVERSGRPLRWIDAGSGPLGRLRLEAYLAGLRLRMRVAGVLRRVRRTRTRYTGRDG